ncbi:NAD(P)-binding protein [Tuber magnatum]|uniref:NAD(P)-binding protein n=1 Tax=Tuber magnatum TaxID=42249 RepID=A0A317SVE0_9PEZI|nr:NAD(P)-binding protein [Tuber magnatum]
MARIFITGATGYIGGNVLDELVAKYPTYVITALARTETAAAALSKKYPTIRIAMGDLDSITVLETESEKADVVIHTADADHPASAKALIAGVSRRPQGGLLLHTSGLTIIMDKPNGDYLNPRVWDDIADVNELTSLPDTHWHRPVDKIILEAPENVRTAIICPPRVIGLGKGIKNTGRGTAALKESFKKAGPFQINSGAPKQSYIHNNDLAKLYLLLVSEGLKPDGGAAQWKDEGYYFAEGGEASIAEIAEASAKALGLGAVREISLAEAGDIGRIFTILCGVNARCDARRARKLGWEPTEKSYHHALAEEFAALDGENE